MSDSCRGRALIIDINAFYDNGRLSDVREGSEVDYYNISKLLTDLRFKLVKSQSELSNLNAGVRLALLAIVYSLACYLRCALESFVCFCSLFSEQHELDVSEELTSTTGCHGGGLNRALLSPWASTLPLSYPATYN